MTPIEISRVVHGANRALRIINGEDPGPDWEDATPEMRNATINGIQFRRENPDATPEMQHEKWRAEYEANGWVLGPVKDRDAKTHPCLVPYSELPEGQRMKDKVFCAIVDAMIGE